ncbi:MAG: hypothetical protein SV862_12290, partial [Pseudomonadota bacterium]|nr:hypothetical protein [Pseudomonadota bacterium]
LPRAEVQATEATLVPANSVARGHETILAVEDNGRVMAWAGAVPAAIVETTDTRASAIEVRLNVMLNIIPVD